VEKFRTLDERAIDDAQSVVLQQPHRRGAADPSDPRLASPLGRFCIVQKLRPECWDAGEQYGQVVRRDRRSRGLLDVGWRFEIGPEQPPDAATLAARRVLARKARSDADAVLKPLAPGLTWALIGLCCDGYDQPAHWTFLLRRGLFELAVFFGLVEQFHR
jgi:hypothetical protein